MGHYATVYVVLYGMIAPMVMTQECESSINRNNSKNEVTICCKVSCKPGFFVDICKVNGTADKCERCPEGTYLDDTTNSDFPVKCRAYDCPPEAVPASTFPPKSACPKKCICDVRQKYVGTDPCACMKARVNCTDGTSLTINDTCEATGKEPTTITYQPIHTTPKQNPEYTISTEGTTLTPNFTTPSPNPGSGEVDKKGLRVIIIATTVLLFAVVVLFVAIGVICYRKRRERLVTETIERGGENRRTDQIPLNATQYRAENNASQIVRNGSVNSRRKTEIFANGSSQLDANEDADDTSEERKGIFSMQPEHKELHAMKNGSMNSIGTNVYRSPKSDNHGRNSWNGTFLSDKTNDCASALRSAPPLSPSSMDDDPASYDLEEAPPLESLLTGVSKGHN